MPVIHEGEEYFTLPEASAYFCVVPQKLYLRPRQMAGHPVMRRIEGRNGFFFKRAEIEAFAVEYTRREPGKSIFGHPLIAIKRGVIPGVAGLSHEGEAEVQRLLADWLDKNAAGRRDQLAAFLASLERQAENV